MKKVQRWKYYCDFCKKSGGSGFHLGRHEKSCTLNPGRTCKMCALFFNGNGADMAEMLALLPPAPEFKEPFSFDAERIFAAEVEAAMPALRALTDNCPACILAALRIKKIPVPIVESFDFKKELAAAMADLNADRAEGQDVEGFHV